MRSVWLEWNQTKWIYFLCYFFGVIFWSESNSLMSAFIFHAVLFRFMFLHFFFLVWFGFFVLNSLKKRITSVYTLSLYFALFLYFQSILAEWSRPCGETELFRWKKSDLEFLSQKLCFKFMPRFQHCWLVLQDGVSQGFFFFFSLRSSIAYMIVFNSPSTWAATFRLRGYKRMLIIFVFP